METQAIIDAIEAFNTAMIAYGPHSPEVAACVPAAEAARAEIARGEKLGEIPQKQVTYRLTNGDTLAITYNPDSGLYDLARA